MTGYVYMPASQKRGMIYIGVTNSLGRRMREHKVAGRGSAANMVCGGSSGMRSISTSATLSRAKIAQALAAAMESRPDAST